MTLKDVCNKCMAVSLASTGVPLRLVVNWAKPDMVRMMLDIVVKPNVPCHDSVNMALHVAVQKGNYRLEITRMLLDRGADVNAVDQHGYTPLQVTLRQRYPVLRMVKLLVSRGAKVVSVANNSKETPLLTAVTFNQPLSVVKFLVKHGANPIEERTVKGDETVLHIACVHQRSDLIDFFLHLGMDVNTMSSTSGLNLVSCQVIKDCEPEFFEFLMSRNAEVDDTIVTLSEQGCRPIIKHFESKVRLYMVYARMKLNGPIVLFSSMLVTLVLVFDWVLPMFEISALQDFLMDNMGLSNPYSLEEYLPEGFKNYMLVCKEELERMKDEKLHGDVPLLNLLTDDISKVVRYIRNREMIKSLVETDLKNRYPIYSAYLVIILDNVKEQHRLKEKTAARLAQLQGLDPHHLCVRKIVNFLGPQDVRKFLSCFENGSKSDE